MKFPTICAVIAVVRHRRLPSALLGQGAVLKRPGRPALLNPDTAARPKAVRAHNCTMRFLLPVALAVVLLTGGAAHAYKAIGAGTD
jgi:hypothetical protein